MSAGEFSARLSLPKSTVDNWGRAAKAGKLGEIGRNRKPLTEVEVELARVKRELAVTRMERDILKNYRESSFSPDRRETSLLHHSDRGS